MNRRLGGDASLNAPLREEGEGEWQDWLVDDAPDQESQLADREESNARLDALRGALDGVEPARTADLRSAPAGRRSDHARGTVGRIRRLARARAADRGQGLREGSGGGQGRGRQGAGAEAGDRGAAGVLSGAGDVGTGALKPELR